MDAKRALLIARGLALAYCHLPLVIVAYFAGGSWRWLAMLGMFPWIGMTFPCTLAVIIVVLAICEGLLGGHPSTWLPPPASAIVLIGGTLLLFLPLYRVALDRTVDRTGRTRMYWAVVTALWTLSGNALAILFEPRGLR